MINSLSIALIQACIAKDRAAQKQLYTKLLPYLNAICRRYLYHQDHIEDVLQESFIAIFKNLPQYDLNRASFKTWATKITINKCLKQNLKQRNTKDPTAEDELMEQVVQTTVIEELTNEEVLSWLKKMPDTYYQVFNLYVIEEYTHNEIAELLKIDVSLSRKRLSRARDWVKKTLGANIKFELYFN